MVSSETGFVGSKKGNSDMKGVLNFEKDALLNESNGGQNKED
jgi:hypothetical protein